MFVSCLNKLVDFKTLQSGYRHNVRFMAISIALQVLCVFATLSVYFAGIGGFSTIAAGTATFSVFEIATLIFLIKQHSQNKKIFSNNTQDVGPMLNTPITPLPNEIFITHIFSLLNFQEIAKFGRTNKHFQLLADQWFLDYASCRCLFKQESSTNENVIRNVKLYLGNIVKSLGTLRKEGHLLEKHVVRNAKRKILPKPTLDLLLTLPETEKHYLSNHMDKALYDFVERGKHDLIQTALICGADPNCPLYHPLALAIKKGDVEAVKLLLEAGANPSRIDKNGYSPLMLNTSNPNLIQLLLNHGADPTYQNPVSKKTAKEYAAIRGHHASESILA